MISQYFKTIYCHKKDRFYLIDKKAPCVLYEQRSQNKDFERIAKDKNIEILKEYLNINGHIRKKNFYGSGLIELIINNFKFVINTPTLPQKSTFITFTSQGECDTYSGYKLKFYKSKDRAIKNYLKKFDDLILEKLRTDLESFDNKGSITLIWKENPTIVTDKGKYTVYSRLLLTYLDIENE